MWQTRTVEEVELCWEALHRVIYSNNGMNDEETSKQIAAGQVTGKRSPFDYESHRRRNPTFLSGDQVRLEGKEVVHVATNTVTVCRRPSFDPAPGPCEQTQLQDVKVDAVLLPSYAHSA